MKKNFYLPTFLFLLAFFKLPNATAQMNMGIQFNYMQPVQEYSENLDNAPKGIGMSFMMKTNFLKKFYLGLQAGVSMYANDSYDFELLSGDKAGELIQIDEEDCFLTYHLIGRYYFIEHALISPYLEGRLGGLSFFSTKLAEEDFREHYESSTTFHGTSFQRGIGGGFVVNAIDKLSFDVGFSYNQGTKTNYRNIDPFKESYRLNPEDGKFNSYTDNLNFSLGVLFSF